MSESASERCPPPFASPSGSHPHVQTALSCPCFSGLPRKPRRPLPFLPDPLCPVNHRDPCDTDIVKIHIVMNATAKPGASIVPPDHWLATGSSVPRGSAPARRSKGLADLRLRHSVPQTAPARLEACQPTDQKDQPYTQDCPDDKSFSEPRSAHRVMSANVALSGATPMMTELDRGRNRRVH